MATNSQKKTQKLTPIARQCNLSFCLFLCLLIVFSGFLLYRPYFAEAVQETAETLYVRELAQNIATNLEKKIKESEAIVSIDLIKVKGSKRSIPLSRLLRKELKKVLDGSSKLTTSPIPAVKTDFFLTGFIRLKANKGELYVKVINTKNGKKLASHKIKSLDLKLRKLYEDSFDDYLQSMVDQIGFSGIDQNFFIEAIEFDANPEPKLGEYVRSSLKQIWEDYVNVFLENSRSTNWIVKTQISNLGTEYVLNMSLITKLGNREESSASIKIPSHLAPFGYLDITSKRFVLLLKNGGGIHSEAIEEQLESYKNILLNAFNQKNLELIVNSEKNQGNAEASKSKPDYIFEAEYSIDTSPPGKDEVAGGVYGTLSLKVFETTNRNLKLTFKINKEDMYLNESDIPTAIKNITKKIQTRLPTEIYKQIRNL